MDGSSPQRLAEQSLERLAELRGDVTQDVLDRYYRLYPDARGSFRDHGLTDIAGLEGRMVTETLYLLMQWCDNPTAAKISQGSTIVHHNDTLEIGPHWYLGMIDAALEVLFETIPDTAHAERDMWIGLRADIAAFIESLREEFWRDNGDGPLGEFVPYRHPYE